MKYKRVSRKGRKEAKAQRNFAKNFPSSSLLLSAASFVSVTFMHESETRNHHRSACKSAEES